MQTKKSTLVTTLRRLNAGSRWLPSTNATAVANITHCSVLVVARSITALEAMPIHTAVQMNASKPATVRVWG